LPHTLIVLQSSSGKVLFFLYRIWIDEMSKSKNAMVVLLVEDDTALRTLAVRGRAKRGMTEES